jgi:hypothetical protein
MKGNLQRLRFRRRSGPDLRAEQKRKRKRDDQEGGDPKPFLPKRALLRDKPAAERGEQEQHADPPRDIWIVIPAGPAEPQLRQHHCKNTGYEKPEGERARSNTPPVVDETQGISFQIVRFTETAG